MCGRFAQPRSSDELARLFRARPVTDLAGDRFNVAPTDEVAAIVEHHGDRRLDVFRWGLVPPWAADTRGASRMINARAETVETSPAYRAAFHRRRCLIPADAFYEWRPATEPESARRPRRPGRPYAVRRRDGSPMALAGLWTVWRDPGTAARLHSCTIVTTQASASLAAIHPRMPVILEPGAWAAWLEEETPVEALRALLLPAASGLLEAYAVSPEVNSVRNNGPHLLDPITRWTEPVA
jgi:putative SOS response-associated peptidase YedK